MKKGFTLIEILVSVAIFSFVVLIAIGSIISILDANRKAQSLSTIVNNLNLAFESMIRDMRTGTNYSINLDSNNNPSSLSFTDKDGNNVTYALSNGVISKTSNNSALPQGAITGSEVTIDTMTFTIKGTNIRHINSNGGDNLPPIVLLHITGHAGANKTQSSFNIQTVITERVLDSLDLPQS